MKKFTLMLLLLIATIEFTYAQCGPGQNIDQSFVNAGLAASTTEQGNSFVAPCTGQIESLTIRVFNVSAAGTATVTIHAGDTGVNPIGTTTINIPAAGGTISTTFATPVPVTSGSTYTYMVDPGSITLGYSMGLGDPYPAGDSLRNLGGTFSAATNPDADFRFIIGFVDEVDPTAVCTDFTAQLDATGNVTITAADVDGGSSDDSGSVTLSIDNDTFDCSNIGANTVTLTATDAAGNTDSCTATVTVEDAIVPTAVCQDITIQLDGTGNATITATSIDNGSTDNCGIASLSVSPSAFTCANLGDNTVTLTVTDTSGNTETCTATVTIEDTEDPVITCPADIVVNNTAGLCEAVVTFADATATDNCAGITVTQTGGPTSGSAFAVGETTITYEASDTSGNTVTCSFTVTVVDAEAPTISCPADITTDNEAGLCGANLTIPQPTFTDQCGTGFAIDSGNVMYNFDTDGELIDTPVTINGLAAAATNVVLELSFQGDHNSSTEDFVLAGPDGSTIYSGDDFSDPCVLVVENITIDQTTWNNWITTFGTNLTFTLLADSGVDEDQCQSTIENYYRIRVLTSGNITLTNDYNGTDDASDFYPVGTTTITWTVADNGGNTATCTQTIVINDIEAPSISCPTDITVDNDAGACTAVVTVPTPSFADNCPTGAGTALVTVTGPVTDFIFDTNGNLIDTPTTLTGLDVSTDDVTMNITTDGDFSANSECFMLTGPDNSTIFTECALVASDCDTANRSLTIPFNTWNGWIATYGSDLTFTLLADTNVDGGFGGCDDTYQLEIITDTSSTLIATNDFNGTADASDTYPVGTTTVTWTVADLAGNSNTCTMDIVVNDTEDPVAVCQDITVQLDASGSATIVGADVDGGSSDNCSVASLAVSPNTFNCSNTGTNTVTLTVTDASGNTSSCIATVTVEDSIAPTISCPADITANNDAGICGAIVTYTAPSGTDNCVATTAQIAGLASGSVFPVGTTTNTFEVTDASGNTATCSFDIIVVDAEAPIITCPADITTGSDPGICGATVSVPMPTVTDNCLGCVQTDDIESFALGQLYGQGGDWQTWTPDTPAQSFEVSTEQALSGTQSVKVEGVPAGGPTDMVYNLGNRSFGAWEVTFNLYIPSGNAAYTNIQKSETSGTQWANQIQYNSDGTADYNVNGGLISFTFPQDTWFEAKYLINIDGNYSEFFIDGVSIVSHAYSLAAGGSGGLTTLGSINFFPVTNFTGNDPNPSAIPLYYVDDISLCPVAVNDYNNTTDASDSYPVGTTNVVWTYTDAAGNVDSCTQAITVNDVEAPIVTSCPTDIVVDNDAGVCGATVTYDAPLSLDNCQATTLAGFTYIGNYNNNAYYLSNGNSNGPTAFTNAEAQNGFVATVTSQEHNDWLRAALSAQGAGSVIIGYTDRIIEGTFEWHSGDTSTYTNWNSGEPNDAGPGEDYTEIRSDGLWNDIRSTTSRRYVIEVAGFPMTQIAGLPSGSVFPVGTTTNTFEVTDAAGNTSTCSFDITVNDVEAPVAVCQDITVQLDVNGEATINSLDIDGGSTDNCGIASMVINSGGIMPAGLYAGGFGTGDVNRFDYDPETDTITLVDDPYGNVPSLPFSIDIEPLTNLGYVLDNSGGDRLLYEYNFANGTVVSELGQVISSSGNANPNAMTFGPDGTLYMLFGNGDLDIFDIDTLTGTSLATGLPSGGNGLTFDYDNDRLIHASGVGTVTLTEIDLAGVATTLGTVPGGACGNSAQAMEYVGNGKIIAGGTWCDDIFTIDVASLTSNTILVDTDYKSFFYTPIPLEVDLPTDFDCSNVGSNTVTLTVTDESGNSSTCTATVTVEDNVTPDAVCMDIDVFLDATGNASITPADVDGGSTDACGIASLAIDITDFTCADVGPNDVTLTVTDVNGNSSSCIAVVTVIDNTAPVISCPTDVVTGTDPGLCSAMVTFSDAIASDECGIATVVQTAGLPSGSDFPVGVSTVEFTATDVNGNATVCSFTITVEDDEDPVAVCQDITIQLDEFGDATITADDVAGVSTDNCGVASTSIDITTFDCSNVGDNVVTLTVTDVNGNSSTCTAIVTVEDVTAPEVFCQDIIVDLDDSGMVTILPTDIDNGSSDACGIDTYELDIDTFDCSNVGDNIVTLTVTDVNGNSATCTATVTVEDNVAPVVSCMDITVELDENGMAVIEPEDVATISDNCGVLTTAIDIFEFSCDDIGTPVTVQIFANDESGNVSSCTAVVTVVDALAPELTCPADQTVDPGPGMLFYEIPDYFAIGEATAVDNCTDPVTDVTQDPAPGTLVPDGVYTITMTATDDSGNTATCTFELTVESVLGLDDLPVDLSTIVVYPNPATDVVFISNPQNIVLEKVTLFDLVGRKVATYDLRNAGIETSIDISNLATASYTLVIEGSGGQVNKRLIKE